MESIWNADQLSATWIGSWESLALTQELRPNMTSSIRKTYEVTPAFIREISIHPWSTTVGSLLDHWGFIPDDAEKKETHPTMQAYCHDDLATWFQLGQASTALPDPDPCFQFVRARLVTSAWGIPAQPEFIPEYLVVLVRRTIIMISLN